mgnify:CR=1 FL=1
MRINGIQGRDSIYLSTTSFTHWSLRDVLRRPKPTVAIFFFFLFLAISILLSGCASNAKIQNVMLPLTTLKKVVVSQMPMGSVRHQSLNGRELTSHYFSPKDFDEDATDRAERAYAKIVILGAGRPYSIEVTVYREKRVKGKYVLIGEDRRLTKELTERIQEAIADRREDRNVIDDFRAF